GLKAWQENHSDWRVPKDFASSKECLDCLECISSITKTKTNSKDKGQTPVEGLIFPEVIIVDVQLINETGFALVKKIKEKWPEIKCVMYSMFDTTGFVLQAKDSGASGYISKVAKEEELLHCLEVVQGGGTYLEQYMQEAQSKVDSIISILTKQERNIFEALLQDKTNKQICDEFFISPRTVENYTSRLYSKVGVKNREELVEKFK
ncbi:MAG: response regulator transcription factor, partial [Treponema sp.]|nr:response regulator transcription factor [Treponema sp.]